MAFADGAPRTLLQGFNPVTITLATACKEGDLLGYSAGWKQADANAGIPAELIAGSAAASGATIQAFSSGVIGRLTGGTAGAALYLSDTAGGYAASASSTSEQKVGQMATATEAFVVLARFDQKFAVSADIVAAGVVAGEAAAYVFTAPFRCRVTKVTEVHGVVAGQAGTLDLIKCASGAAYDAAGNKVLLGTTKIDLAAAINTPQSPALSSTAADLILAVGDSIRCKLATGAATSLANALVTIEFERA